MAIAVRWPFLLPGFLTQSAFIPSYPNQQIYPALVSGAPYDHPI